MCNKLIVTNQELYRYEIHSLVKAFYPADEVKVVVEGDAHAVKYLNTDSDPFLRVVFSVKKIRLCFQNGQVYSRASFSPEIFFNEKGTACKTALKELLYDSLVRITGRELPWGDLIGIRPTKIPMTMLDEGASEEDAKAFLRSSHRVSKEKTDIAVDIAKRERKILSTLHYENGYSIYIGIPFCPTTCLYCSFPSFSLHAWQNRVDEYLDALETEMRESALIMRDRILDTIYIGGGTPTTLEPDQMDRLLEMLKKYFDLSHLQEFTVEAGRPDSITEDKLLVLKKHGITRISVNPQSMKEETLKLIGRRHTAVQTVEAFKLARKCGFDNINMDIILGLPGETPEDVRYTVEEIEKLSPDSLTVHSLAIKRGSRLQKWIEDNGYTAINNTDECMQIASDGAARMEMKPYYLYRQKNMSGNFENTGYARDGKFGIYNILIMEEMQSILALGAGSISKRVFDGGRIERCDNAKEVNVYISNIEEMIERKRKLFAEAKENC